MDNGYVSPDIQTAWAHPKAPEYWWPGSSIQPYPIHRVGAIVAFRQVKIVGLSIQGLLIDQHAEVIQQFIDSQGWKGKAYNCWQWKNFAIRTLSVNGLLEMAMDARVYVVWEWEQIIEWLMNGLPWPSISSDDGAPGTWCHIHDRQNEVYQWELIQPQLKKLGIHKDVRELRRRMTEHEAVEAMCGALKHYRVKKKRELDDTYEQQVSAAFSVRPDGETGQEGNHRG